MQRFILVTLAITFLAVAVPAVGASESPPAADRFEATFRTPSVTFERPDGPEGPGRVTVEGLRARRAPTDAPDIPTRTLLVAIPEGATPRLEVHARDWRVIDGPRPRAVPRRTHELTAEARARLAASRGDERTVLELLQGASRELEQPDPAYYQEGSSWPTRAAWLGEIGYLREQRYVELHLAPVRWDGAGGRIQAAGALDVSVVFDGADPLPPIGEHRPDRFEPIYRRSIANYEQGLIFRRAKTRRPASLEKRAASGGPAPFKILVREDGIVRLDHAALDAAGVITAGADPTQWRLTNRGVDVPLQIRQVAGDDSLLEPGELIQFYGEKLDGEPKTRVNDAGLMLYELADFSDTNVYWLDVAAGPTAPMAERDAVPACGGCATPPWFDETRRIELDDRFAPLATADPWVWGPVLSSTFPPADRTIAVDVPGLFSGIAPATLRVRVRGMSPYDFVTDVDFDPDHETLVTLADDLGTPLATDQQTFDGRIDFDHVIPYAGQSGPLTESLMVSIEALAVTAPTNDVAVDWVEIDYRRSFTVEDDHLTFEWPDGDEEFVVGGLTTTTNLEVFELEDVGGVSVATRLSMVEVSVGPAPYSVRFRIDDVDPGGTPQRRFVISAGAPATPSPSDLYQDVVSDLRNTSNQADMLVITHEDLLDMGPGPCVAPDPTGCLPELLAHRASAAGGGLTSQVILIEDVQDEFADGLAGPDGLRELLRFVLSDEPGEGWADPKPSFVLLLGDASYASKAGTGGGEFVPTQVMFRQRYELGHYSSDNRLASVVGNDDYPDLFLGRIPARDVDDANIMLEKILSYEQATPPGPWRSHALFLSDRGHLGNEAGEAQAFETINERGREQLDGTPFSSRHVSYYADYYTQLPAADARMAMHDEIVDAVNGADGFSDGAAVVQYTGHGNFFIWSDDSYWDERDNPQVPNELEFDSFELLNGSRLPLMMAHNCLTGGFHITQSNSIGENWLRRENGGGVAVFAPSGLSFDFIGLRASEEVWDAMVGPEKLRGIGEIAWSAIARLCDQGSIEPCQHYVLLGDPATRLAFPSVEPPTNVTATSGNGEITLDWSASTTPGATYDIYRFELINNRFYVNVNPTPIGGTSFVDTGLENTRRYYYHVVAVDAAGYESRWSHFNSDCGVSGPDCLTEVPLNPDPPSIPTGLALGDPGTGTVLAASWIESPEPDVDHYTVFFGTSSGSYDQSVVVGTGGTATISGLVAGQTYYVALSATNTSGKTSGLSAEVNATPIEAFGVRPPAFISDLRVRNDAGDALLEWGEVTTNGYGQPTSVTAYEIFRGVAPDYTNAGLTLIATCPAPCVEFRDVGAIAAPQSHHYRVRAVGAAGVFGSLGSEYPRWTMLSVSLAATPGNLDLSWSPVTTTIGGGPAAVLRYDVYVWNQPFSRTDIADGLVPAPTAVTGTSLELTPAPGPLYMSVIVVDLRGNMSPY